MGAGNRKAKEEEVDDARDPCASSLRKQNPNERRVT